MTQAMSQDADITALLQYLEGNASQEDKRITLRAERIQAWEAGYREGHRKGYDRGLNYFDTSMGFSEKGKEK